jgi:hypothetical protein
MSKTDDAIANEDAERVLLIEQARLPPSFDDHIATVSLGSQDNTASDGYSLFITAMIGCDQTTILVDGEPISVEIEVRKAEVRLAFVNCKPAWGQEYFDLFRDERSRINKVSESHRKSSFSVDTSLIGMGVEANKKNIDTVEISKPEFLHSRIELIEFGDWKKENHSTIHPLKNYIGWQIFHNTDAVRSGVLARLRVKRNWLKITEVTIRSQSKLSRLYNSLKSATTVASAKKLDFFNKLLEELVFRGLQKPNEKEYATLSVSGVQVSEEDSLYTIPSEEERERLSIPANLLMRILTAKEGTETDVLNDIIVSQEERRRIESLEFVPQASYTDTLQLFRELAIRHTNDQAIQNIESLRERHPVNAISELSVLGIIRRQKGVYLFCNPFPTLEYTESFETIIRAQSTIKKTIEILSVNPEISNRELGGKIGEFLGRHHWKKSTMQRNGMQLKNWARQRGSETKKRQKSISDDELSM